MPARPPMPAARPADLRRLVGSPRQLARADLVELLDGPGRGSRVARLTAADGFDIEVLADRGMDLGMVSWRGLPLAWSSPVGLIAAERLGSTAESWDRGFGGGLLATCGLDQFGRPSRSETGAALPMHGRAHTLAASDVRVWADPLAEDGSIGFAGTTRQASALGECLRLDRVVAAPTNGTTIAITDRVTNEAPVPWPHLILYHVNLGWPLLDPDAILQVGADDEDDRNRPGTPIPRDAAAEDGLATWHQMPAPQDRFDEQVFRHPLDGLDAVRARLTSPSAGVALSVRFASAELPVLYQWKQASAGRYALGIEPANAVAIGGQEEARANGTLPVLEPGESREYTVTFEIEQLRAESVRPPAY